MRWIGRNELGLAITLLALVACGGGTEVEADPSVAPFVGTWDATVLTMTSDAEPTLVYDVLQAGEFFIVVEPSGQYTASLDTVLGTAVEIGQLTVIGNTLRLDPTHPPGASSATSTYAFTSADYLVLDGPTEFDFNGDQVRDPATAHFELQRRS